jgi:hypothetical protein
MALKWKRRCFRCLQYLRDDGTCQNPKCVRYVDESAKDEQKSTSGATADAAASATEAKA